MGSALLASLALRCPLDCRSGVSDQSYPRRDRAVLIRRQARGRPGKSMYAAWDGGPTGLGWVVQRRVMSCRCQRSIVAGVTINPRRRWVGSSRVRAGITARSGQLIRVAFGAPGSRPPSRVAGVLRVGGGGRSGSRTIQTRTLTTMRYASRIATDRSCPATACDEPPGQRTRAEFRALTGHRGGS